MEKKKTIKIIVSILMRHWVKNEIIQKIKQEFKFKVIILLNEVLGNKFYSSNLTFRSIILSNIWKLYYLKQ